MHARHTSMRAPMHLAAEAPHTYYAAWRRESTANTQDTQTNRHTPDFVVGTGVTTSTIARAAHDTFVEDRLHLNGVCRRSKWPRGLRHTRTHTRAHAHTPFTRTYAQTHIPTSHSHPHLSVCEGVCVCAVLSSAIFLFSVAIGVCEIMSKRRSKMARERCSTSNEACKGLEHPLRYKVLEQQMPRGNRSWQEVPILSLLPVLPSFLSRGELLHCRLRLLFK